MLIWGLKSSSLNLHICILHLLHPSSEPKEISISVRQQFSDLLSWMQWPHVRELLKKASLWIIQQTIYNLDNKQGSSVSGHRMLDTAGSFCASVWPTAGEWGQQPYSSNGKVIFTEAKTWLSHWKPMHNMLFKLIHGEKADAERMKCCLPFWGTLVENVLQL